MSDDALALEVRKEELPEAEVAILQSSFITFLQQAEAMKEQALSINVTNVDQVDEIKKAREWRITIKNIRVDCEKVRKKMKEDSLRRGRAIDGMANVIKDLIAPIEEHLDNQEKFVERQEQQRIEELRRKRVAEIAQYQVDGNAFQNLGEMPEEQYTLLLSGLKAQFEKALEQAKKNDEIEKERVRKEAADREQQRIEKEKTDIENAKLKKKLAIEKEKTDAERVKREAEENKRIEAERKLKETKKEIKEEKKAEASAPRARAYSCGVLQLDGDDIPDSAKKGDLCIFLRDTPENRHVQAHLMRP
jgi:hypothetical protein